MLDPLEREGARQVWGVAALLLAAGDALAARLGAVAVRGEISGFSRAASGHCYLSLKDAGGAPALLRCAMFRRAAALLDFVPADGMQVELRGRMYRVLVDGHHNLAAARLAGVEPAWRGASRKLQRAMQEMGPAAFARMLINNLTDSDWYDVDTGRVVLELLGTERKFA